MMPLVKTVLFVCTGNTCRSPMAEAIARQYFAVQGQDVFVASAGVMALQGMPTSARTLETLRSMGIEHEGRSTPLTADMIRKADLVFCMTSGHADAAADLVKGDTEAAARIVLMREDGEMPDPIGMGQDTYDELGRTLAELIPARLETLLD